MPNHICQSCAGPLDEYEADELKNPDFCPYCVNELGELKDYKDILQNMIEYLSTDHPEIEQQNRSQEAEQMLEQESPIWSQIFTGVIIEESLQDKTLFDYVEVTATQESHNPDPETNHGFPDWHIHTISFKRTKLAKVLEILKDTLRPGKWWADLAWEAEVYVIFRDKIFAGKKTDTEFVKAVADFARSLGLPEDQVPFNI